MPDTPDRVPLAEGWTIGVKPNASGDYWVYAPDGTASTYYSAQWLIEHGQPVPERPLAVGDRVRHVHAGDGVVSVPADREGVIGIVSDGGLNLLWGVSSVTRVVES